MSYLYCQNTDCGEYLGSLGGESCPHCGWTEPAIEQPSVHQAVQTLIDAMQADPDYAWSWHCNIAMAYVDAGGDPYTGNQGAARFMRLFANVDPAHELPAPQAQQTAPVQEPVAWAHDRFIENDEGMPIGTDEPELQWGRYIPDEDGGWFPLFTASQAQPDEKPVGEVASYPDVVDWYSDEPPIGTKLYAAPQAQQPRKAVKLTPYEIKEAIRHLYQDATALQMSMDISLPEFRAIEQAVLKKNGVTE